MQYAIPAMSIRAGSRPTAMLVGALSLEILFQWAPLVEMFKFRSLSVGMVYRMSGPVAWGGGSHRLQRQQGLCEVKPQHDDEGTPSRGAVRNLCPGMGTHKDTRGKARCNVAGVGAFGLTSGFNLIRISRDTCPLSPPPPRPSSLPPPARPYCLVVGASTSGPVTTMRLPPLLMKTLTSPPTFVIPHDREWVGSHSHPGHS